MTWSYSSDYSTQKDRVRDLIGDTDNADPLLSDEQIGKYCTGGSFAQGNDYTAAAACAGEIAAKFARRANSISEGGTSVNWGDLAKQYRDMMAALRTQSLRLSGVAGYAGGISISDKSIQQDDTDATVPAFTRQMGDTWDRELQPISQDRDR